MKTQTREYKSIHQLHAMLSERGIPHEMKELNDGWSIAYPAFDESVRLCSVIEHWYSLGHDMDLLEIHGLLRKDELERSRYAGHLTAHDVFMRIENDYNRRRSLNDAIVIERIVRYIKSKKNPAARSCGKDRPNGAVDLRAAEPTNQTERERLYADLSRADGALRLFPADA